MVTGKLVPECAALKLNLSEATAPVTFYLPAGAQDGEIPCVDDDVVINDVLRSHRSADRGSRRRTPAPAARRIPLVPEP